MFSFTAGTVPLLISLPHVGTRLPVELQPRLTEAALTVVDTDWYVDRLWAFAKSVGASWLQPTYSRYVVDLNRPSEDVPLYPGQVSTGLCPTHRFDGVALYKSGCEPDAVERSLRTQNYWQPYHQTLQAELTRLKAQFGLAILIDAHSIQSRVPRLFAGRLPDINLGTFDSQSLTLPAEQALLSRLREQSEFSLVLNERFKGGYITRHYGQPSERVYALQVELAQCTYMDEQKLIYDDTKAPALIATLQTVVDVLLTVLV